MVRAGRHGEREEIALEKNIIAIGWSELPDLSKISSKEDLELVYLKNIKGKSKMAVANHVGQLWRFIKEISIDDFIALPLKSQSAVAIGKVKGEYKYTKEFGENFNHTRQVEWIKTIPRKSIDQDILYSLSAQLTVCQIKRNDAEKRILQLLDKEETVDKTIGEVMEVPSEREEDIDIERFARDQIEKYLEQKFKGHDLARIVEAILIAQGYETKVSPPGPDGGIDIFAAAGPLGFNSPKICVQVKSTAKAADVKILRELQGVMQKIRADKGLLVSFGGFSTKALREARDAFFSIRLWDSGVILDEIFKHYDKFDDELKAELPLKRIWNLVNEEVE